MPLVCGARRARDCDIDGAGSRADGVCRHGPGHVAARKSAGGHAHPAGHDLCCRRDRLVRARDIKGSLLLSFYAIAAGSSVVIAGMLATGTLTADIAVLVPVGSMIIANAMNA